MKIKTALFVFITTIAFVFNCGKSDKTYTIEIKDGVNYVHNHAPLWGDTLKVALEYVQKIGEFDAADENYLFHYPSDVERDSDGNIYIVDQGNYRIQKFDATGKYIMTIGKRGQGPGEFGNPFKMRIGPGENLYVSDGTFIRIFSKDGNYIKSINFPRHQTTFAINRKGEFVMPHGLIMEHLGDKVKESVMVVRDSSGSVLYEFGEAKKFETFQFAQFGNSVYFGLDSEDNICLSFSYQNRIEKYSPEGRLLFKADRPINFEIKYEMGIRKFESDGITREMEWPIFTWVSADLNIDHKGRIWIRTYKRELGPDEEIRKAEDMDIELYDQDGIMLGKLKHPEHSGRMKIIGNRVYIMNSEEECVYEYKIVEK